MFIRDDDAEFYTLSILTKMKHNLGGRRVVFEEDVQPLRR